MLRGIELGRAGVGSYYWYSLAAISLRHAGNNADWRRRLPLGTLKRFPFRVVRVFSGSGRNGPLFRDVQDRIDELADVLKAGNGVEASAARVADEELGATGECRRQNEECRMGVRGAGNRFPEQLRAKAPRRFHEAQLRGMGVPV